MAGISLASLQARLLRIADANVVDFFEADQYGRLRLLNLAALPGSVTAPIAELQVKADGEVKLKCADKLHAIDTLLKTVGGFAPEQHDHRVSLEESVRISMGAFDQFDESENGGNKRPLTLESLDAAPTRPSAPAKTYRL